MPPRPPLPLLPVVWMSVASASWLTACADGTAIADLDRPVIVLEYGSPLCHDVVAIDAHNAVWKDHACEAAFELVRQDVAVTSDVRRDLEDALAALPDPATLAVDDCDASSEDGFLLTWDAAAGRVTWLGCMPRDGLPEAPFDAVFAELVAL